MNKKYHLKKVNCCYLYFVVVSWHNGRYELCIAVLDGVAMGRQRSCMVTLRGKGVTDTKSVTDPKSVMDPLISLHEEYYFK